MTCIADGQRAAAAPIHGQSRQDIDNSARFLLLLPRHPRTIRMARAKVVEFDYYQFLRIMQRAGNAGQRIDKSDARWAGYVREKKINEVAATAIARQKFENPTAVIIDEGSDTDGLYFFSKDDEACLRLTTLE
jgi:pyridoxal/pyridoxine/pyridoxamine kinase